MRYRSGCDLFRSPQCSVGHDEAFRGKFMLSVPHFSRLIFLGEHQQLPMYCVLRKGVVA